MPAFIKTKEDERLWQKAQEIAEEAGHKENWAYVTGVYKKMKGGKVGGMGPVTRSAQAWLDKTFGKGLLVADVGEKGHVDVDFTAKGLKELKKKRASSRVAARWLARGPWGA